ncbi:NUDIX domain-containing protein [Candidatus Woesearchaeota archaeon]|nr:NUDIX domain-containing protein [Candidatus Woesearchaeota archaeon]
MRIDMVVAGYLVHEGKVLLIKHRKLGKWLPVGGHIEKDEIPDDALKREFKEEVNLRIEIIDSMKNLQVDSDVRQLKNPFHVNVHNVGDHEHCCLFYICRTADSNSLKMNRDELLDFRWLSGQEIDEIYEKEDMPSDVRSIAKLALEAAGQEDDV